MTSRVKEILDACESKDPATGTFADLESALIGLPRIRYYQDVKPIIKEADRLGCYPTVVKNFLQTNKSAFGNVACEFVELANQYGIQ